MKERFCTFAAADTGGLREVALGQHPLFGPLAPADNSDVCSRQRSVSMTLQSALFSPKGGQIRALSKVLSRLMLGSLAPQYPTDIRRQ
eukprot:3844450-Pyramimonas_sp.AAC.1